MHSAKQYDTTRSVWTPVAERGWDGAAWRQASKDYTTARQSPYEPYLPQGSVFTRDVSVMPLATNSASQAAWMASHINYGSGFGPTSLNTSTGGTRPVYPVVVDSRMPGCNFVHMTCAATGATGYGAQILTGWVPWPAWLDASCLQSGQDSSIVIIDIGTGVVREYYWVTQTTGYANRFAANQGGFSVYEPDLAGWVSSNYPMQLTYGLNTVVAMHNWAGWIDIASARRGQINHAIAFTCANMALPDTNGEAIDPGGVRYTTKGPSWPAQGGDGDTANPSDQVPIHGQWARLPMSLDLSETGPYPPFVRMVIKAIQTYGMVATDSNNFVHAFNAEPGFTERQFLGVDPWSASGDLTKTFQTANAREGRDTAAPFSMASFPWALTEWAPRHWGAPARINAV